MEQSGIWFFYCRINYDKKEKEETDRSARMKKVSLAQFLNWFNIKTETHFSKKRKMEYFMTNAPTQHYIEASHLQWQEKIVEYAEHNIASELEMMGEHQDLWCAIHGCATCKKNYSNSCSKCNLCKMIQRRCIDEKRKNVLDFLCNTT
jgi:hypothetical protein